MRGDVVCLAAIQLLSPAESQNNGTENDNTGSDDGKFSDKFESFGVNVVCDLNKIHNSTSMCE